MLDKESKKFPPYWAVSRMTAALLQAAGIKVGLYTSPLLAHFRERISVNGQPNSEWDLVDACNHVKPFMDSETNSVRLSSRRPRPSSPFAQSK